MHVSLPALGRKMVAAPVDTVEKRGMELRRSVRRGNRSQLTALLRLGADVNARDLPGDSALHIASMHGHADCIVTLLEAGAQINMTGSNGFSPLMYSCFYGMDNCSRVLIEEGADVDIVNGSGDTALILSSSGGYEGCATLLIRSGADVNAVDTYGRSCCQQEPLWTLFAKMAPLHLPMRFFWTTTSAQNSCADTVQL